MADKDKDRPELTDEPVDPTDAKEMEWWICKTGDRLDGSLPEEWGYILVLMTPNGTEGYVSNVDPEDARPAVMRCHSRLPGGGN